MRTPVGILFILLAVFLNGCIVIDMQDDGIMGKKNVLVKPKQPEVIQPPNLNRIGRQCKLDGLVNRIQENSSWCWVASTQMVLEFISHTPINSQCDFATEILKPELQHAKVNNVGIVQDRPVECCQAIGKASLVIGAGNALVNNSTKEISQEVCIRGGWPEFVFESLEKNTGKGYWWEATNDWAKTDPNLVWEQLDEEICQNRPFIFVVRWDEAEGGGRHTSVGGGTQHIGGINYVEVYDHFPAEGGSDIYLMPFDSFLGEPGEFVHEWDYIKIRQK